MCTTSAAVRVQIKDRDLMKLACGQSKGTLEQSENVRNVRYCADPTNVPVFKQWKSLERKAEMLWHIKSTQHLDSEWFMKTSESCELPVTWVFSTSLFCVTPCPPEPLEGVWSAVPYVARTIYMPLAYQMVQQWHAVALALTSIWKLFVWLYKRRPASNKMPVWNYTAIYVSSVITVHPLWILWQPIINKVIFFPLFTPLL